MDLYFVNGIKGFVAGVLGVLLFFAGKEAISAVCAWLAARKLDKQRAELRQYEARLRAAETCTACGHVGRKTPIRAKYHTHDVFGYMCSACGAHTDYNGSSLTLAERDWINKPLNPPEPDFDAEVLRSPRVHYDELPGGMRSTEDAPEEDAEVSVKSWMLYAAIKHLDSYAVRCGANTEFVRSFAKAAGVPYFPLDEDVVNLEALLELMNQAETEGTEKPLSEEECFLIEHAMQRDFVMVNGNANVYACTERQLVDFVRERGGQVERNRPTTEHMQQGSAEHGEWLADKICAGGDYAKEAAWLLRRWASDEGRVGLLNIIGNLKSQLNGHYGALGKPTTVKLNNDGMAVDQTYHWNYDMSACPSGKAQLLTMEGIATHGKVNDYREGFIVAWTGLPKTRE